MKARRLLAATAAVTTLSGAAAAQDGGFELNSFEPAPAGDTFLGVPSPGVGGHLVPRAYAMFDYAHRPIRIRERDKAVVSAQGFLRADVSLSLWDRLLGNHTPLRRRKLRRGLWILERLRGRLCRHANRP